MKKVMRRLAEGLLALTAILLVLFLAYRAYQGWTGGWDMYLAYGQFKMLKYFPSEKPPAQ